MQPRIETRRAVRQSVALPCEVVSDTRFRLLGRQMRDLTTFGLRVVTEARVLTGQPVVVCFKIPGSGRFFDALGVVARVLHGRRPGDRERELAVEFTQTEETSVALLERQLAFFVPVRSERQRLPAASLPSCALL